jgi:NitT/TauT family transport system substrate-binding protein
MEFLQTRRNFLRSATGVSLAGTAGFVVMARSLRAEAAPESTTVRFARQRAICIAPQYAAETLLHAEGFLDVQYVPVESGAAISRAMANDEIDFSVNFSAPSITSIDSGEAVTLLAGVHPGCFELFGNETIRSITDLKGKKVGIENVNSVPHLFTSVIAAYYGLDPAEDIDWVTTFNARPIDAFADNKVDAFLGFPPEPQEARARSLGHVVVNSAFDHPWSQYFCCFLRAHRSFVAANPVATKRVIRAVLKAADLCVAEPSQVARQLVDGGFAERYDYALQALADVPYQKWRDYDPEDTVRFYALRLHELGMIKKSPEEIIAAGTDWSFLNDLRHELKG